MHRTSASPARMPGARRIGLTGFSAFLMSMLLALSALPALAAIDDPPAFPNTLVVFPERDFMVIENGPANERMDVRLLRNGVVIGTATGTTDATGFLEVNHPGGVCWDRFTPNVIPFDVVEVIFADQGLDANGEPFGMRTTTRNVVVTRAAFVNAAGNVEMNGTAEDASGAPLPIDELEARVINPDFIATEIGRRDIRAPGNGTISYDAPGSSEWTAVWTGLSAAAKNAAVAGQSRILSWDIDPASQEPTGITIYEFGEVGGPGIEGCPPSANYAVTSSDPATYTGAGNLVVSGVSHDASAVSVSLDDENPATAAITAGGTPTPATGSQTWSVTFAGADVNGLSDGTLTAVGTYTVTDPDTGQPVQIGGLNLTIRKVTAPNVTAPVHSIKVGSALGTTNVPVTQTWSSSNPARVASYQLQRSVNGGAFTSVALATPTSTTKTQQLAPGANSYRYRVRATSTSGIQSAFATGHAFNVTAFQESNGAIAYGGAWSTQALAGAYGGSVRHASVAGRTATLTFTGDYVAWASTRGPNRGKAEVRLDGVLVQTVDLYAASQQTRRVVFSSPVSGAGSHTLQVRVTGTKRAASTGTRVDIDAFVALS